MEGAHEAASATASSVPPFLSKTYEMVDYPATDAVVSWSAGNNSFVVWKVPEFARDLLPKYFKHNNFSSFVRQLNTYGFRKVDPDRWEFANEGFLRGQKHLLKTISRRKPAHAQNHQQTQAQVQNTSRGACVEVGNFGLEEEIERLKRDKNVLMQELVRLRQQQQATDNQLLTVGQRVQVMEQRQQQMMSFLAKAMQSPGFLAQMVQQQNESNRRITGVSKKRRLSKQEDDGISAEHASGSPDGQIVKYQPLISKAAKAMLRQILKMNTSSRRESLINNPDAFLIDDVPPSSTALDTGSSSSRISEVTFAEVAPTSGESCLQAESGLTVNSQSAAISEMQSSPGTVKSPQVPGINVLNDGEDTVFPDFAQMQGIMPESTVEVPGVNFVGSESASGEYMDPFSAAVDGTMAIENDGLYNDPEMDSLLGAIPRLPSINDAFWEQFLLSNPLNEDAEEISSNTLECGVKEQEMLPGQDCGWNKAQCMDHLTEQMDLLASAAKRG